MQHPFPYEVIYSDRKSLAIQITAQATVCVRAPKSCTAPTIDTFLYEKQAWILKHLDSASQRLEQYSVLRVKISRASWMYRFRSFSEI